MQHIEIALSIVFIRIYKGTAWVNFRLSNEHTGTRIKIFPAAEKTASDYI